MFDIFGWSDNIFLVNTFKTYFTGTLATASFADKRTRPITKHIPSPLYICVLEIASKQTELTTFTQKSIVHLKS